MVDPANAIDEASETNNAARASVDVRLPKHQFSDITEPFLHRFMVQNQHQVTTMPTVTLAVTATVSKWFAVLQHGAVGDLEV